MWQHTNGGVTLWERRGDDPTNFAQFSNVGGAGNPSWHVVATGDFNQDGRSDLLWQHDNGAVTIWLLDGPSVTQTGLIGGSGSPNWRIVATADFNGDGTENDILWQHTNGAVDIWLHGNSTTADDFQKFSNVGGAGDPNWRIKGTSDVNGDGRSDILFEHAVSGAFVEWTMNGATITQVAPGRWQRRPELADPRPRLGHPQPANWRRSVTTRRLPPRRRASAGGKLPRLRL